MFCLSIQIASKILMEVLTKLIIQEDLQVCGFPLSKISPYLENRIDLPLYVWSIQRQFCHQIEIRLKLSAMTSISKWSTLGFKAILFF
jgi:DNA mismatch repair ATPase MutS